MKVRMLENIKGDDVFLGNKRMSGSKAGASLTETCLPRSLETGVHLQPIVLQDFKSKTQGPSKPTKPHPKGGWSILISIQNRAVCMWSLNAFFGR